MLDRFNPMEWTKERPFYHQHTCETLSNLKENATAIQEMLLVEEGSRAALIEITDLTSHKREDGRATTPPSTHFIQPQ